MFVKAASSAMPIKISVLMSAFNAEAYLRGSVNSILNQTFGDFEFIIIDDGSTDNTPEILASYTDSRVIIAGNKTNVGLTRSLDRAIGMAKGEYIARMDADDISLPTRLQKEVDFLDRNTSIGLLGTSWIVIDEHGNESDTARVYNGPEAVHCMCHGSVMIRKECLERARGYRPLFKYSHDYDLWLRLREICGVANLSEPLYKLRIHSGSISVTKKMEQDLFAALAVVSADERRETGRDRLSVADVEGSSKIINEWLALAGIKRRKALAHLYSTWSEAFFRMGEYRCACGHVMQSLRTYPLNSLGIIIIQKLVYHFVRVALARQGRT